MVASREMEHRFLLGTNNNSDKRENQASGSHTFTGATVATLLEKKNDHVVSTMCCCLALGVVNHSVLLLLLLPGYPKFFACAFGDFCIDSRGTLFYEQQTQMADKSGDGNFVPSRSPTACPVVVRL